MCRQPPIEWQHQLNHRQQENMAERRGGHILLPQREEQQAANEVKANQGAREVRQLFGSDPEVRTNILEAGGLC